MSTVEPTRPGRVITNGGAGGNRTPVHQTLFASDTTIPVVMLTQHHQICAIHGARTNNETNA